MEMTPTQAVAAEIRAALARKQVRQHELAAHLGMSQPALSQRLNGRQDISIPEMVEIARFLELDPSDLVKAAS